MMLHTQVSLLQPGTVSFVRSAQLLLHSPIVLPWALSQRG